MIIRVNNAKLYSLIIFKIARIRRMSNLIGLTLITIFSLNINAQKSLDCASPELGVPYYTSFQIPILELDQVHRQSCYDIDLKGGIEHEILVYHLNSNGHSESYSNPGSIYSFDEPSLMGMSPAEELSLNHNKILYKPSVDTSYNFLVNSFSHYFENAFFRSTVTPEQFQTMFLIREKIVSRKFYEVEKLSNLTITNLDLITPVIVNVNSKSGPVEKTITKVEVKNSSNEGFLIVEISDVRHESSQIGYFKSKQVAILDLSKSDTLEISNDFYNRFIHTNSIQFHYSGKGNIDISITKISNGSLEQPLTIGATTSLNHLGFASFFGKEDKNYIIRVSNLDEVFGVTFYNDLSNYLQKDIGGNTNFSGNCQMIGEGKPIFFSVHGEVPWSSVVFHSLSGTYTVQVDEYSKGQNGYKSCIDSRTVK